MAFPDQQTIERLVAQPAGEFGYDVEKITIARAGAKSSVKIAVDADEKPDLDAVEQLSRRVSEVFDAAEERGEVNFGPGYTLEVSTPGLDFPLELPRHWRRNVGRLVRLPGGGVRRVLAVDEAAAEVGLLEPKKMVVSVVALADVSGAVVEVEFNEPPAAQVELVGRCLAELRQLVQQ